MRGETVTTSLAVAMTDVEQARFFVMLSILVLVLGGYLVHVAAKRWRLHRAVKSAPTLTCANLAASVAAGSGVICRVEGIAEPGPRGMLTAPVSRQPSVWYHSKVTKVTGTWTGDQSRRSEKILINDGASWEFAIRDATGEILVDPDAKAVDEPVTAVRKRSVDAIPAFGLPKASGQRYEISERLIPRGHNVYVVGEAVRDPDGNGLLMRRPRGGVFLIAPSEGRRPWWPGAFSALAGLVCLAAAVAGLIIFVPAL